MAYNERDFQTALVCGLMSKGRELKGVPTSYLYNGVELPALPESELPYKVILKDVNDRYCCVFANVQKTVADEGVYSNIETIYYAFSDGAWESNSGTLIGYLIWANYDVYYSNNEALGELAGTLYLEASDPIPVYE